MVKRRICVFTGSRAEYGHLVPVMKALRANRKFALRTLVSGTHLSPKFGLTYKDIEADGFTIDEKVEMPLKGDGPQAVCDAIGSGFPGFARAYRRMRPCALLMLGDRYESFAAAAAAMIARIPIVHFNGGEATYGLLDEAFRHSITKMSHIHFTSTEAYRNRVIQLGEHPAQVFCVGALSLDTIKKASFLGRLEMEKVLGITLQKPVIAVTFHPVTLEDRTAGVQFRKLLQAVDRLQNATVVFTMANADPNARPIDSLTKNYVAANTHKARRFASLGYHNYHSLLSHADVVLGNSSSGIIEAPSFGIPTVDIGDRQRGRVKAASVVQCRPTATGITQALTKALTPGFRRICRRVKNPYGTGHAAENAVRILEKQLARIDLKKVFYTPPGWRPTVQTRRNMKSHG